MKPIKIALAFSALALLFSSCSKSNNNSIEEPGSPRLIFKFKFDPNQVRLNNIGQPSVIASGNAAQSPKFNLMSSHYIEMAPNAFTALGSGTVLFHAAETAAGGSNAIDFSKNKAVGDGEEFFSIPIKEVKPGTYEYLRVSLAYQNYDILFKAKNPLDQNTTLTTNGTLASFIGFNTYIGTLKIKNTSIEVNANKKQGFWAFETMGLNFSGDASKTTVVNPINSSSPIPQGSCVVTGSFNNMLTITGNETQDIVIEVRLSTNNSFEWREVNADGYFQPDIGEIVEDMGVRGMIPVIK
ncbi:hypothetical protein [Solitalea lacus]|uniref:hypothetical protein n=1 Tax=Solitalea lacus TaxID=2911172 RepID=UPI001EDB181A|nr:hypothetical protein [Solitalea lacus]UKJ07819.1 hypothetical protein L2B55_01325 [Solitalea lacus]